jgi:hypothetical protein
VPNLGAVWQGAEGGEKVCTCTLFVLVQLGDRQQIPSLGVVSQFAKFGEIVIARSLFEYLFIETDQVRPL